MKDCLERSSLPYFFSTSTSLSKGWTTLGIPVIIPRIGQINFKLVPGIHIKLAQTRPHFALYRCGITETKIDQKIFGALPALSHSPKFKQYNNSFSQQDTVWSIN